MKFFVAVRRAAGVVTFDFVPSSLAPLHRRQVRVSLAASTSSIDDGSRLPRCSQVPTCRLVADAQQERSGANEGSMQALARSLAAYGQKLEETPLSVPPSTTSDLPNRMALADLQRLLNPRCVPHFEATARTGHGVFDSPKSVVGQILARERGARAPTAECVPWCRKRRRHPPVYAQANQRRCPFGLRARCSRLRLAMLFSGTMRMRAGVYVRADDAIVCERRGCLLRHTDRPRRRRLRELLCGREEGRTCYFPVMGCRIRARDARQHVWHRW